MSALLEVCDLVKHFEPPEPGGRAVRAVDGVTLAVEEGETLALVGESGCGKSTLSRVMLRLYEPTSGTVWFDGMDITHLPERKLRPLRGQMQAVFQDPYGSLNPRQPVGTIVGDVLRTHGVREREQRERRVGELLQRVGLLPEHSRRYPREFSGGQRQRIAIARALALHPRLIVADEPVSALDVSIQAQVLNLLMDLQQDLGLTYVLIAHDLGLVRQVADRVAVMYLGKLAEIGNGEDLYRRPIHPYTEALLSAVPIPDPVASAQRQRIILTGDLPSPTDPPAACRFHTRCPFATEICRSVAPPLVEHEPGHVAACHHPRNVGELGKLRAAAAAQDLDDERLATP